MLVCRKKTVTQTSVERQIDTWMERQEDGGGQMAGQTLISKLIYTKQPRQLNNNYLTV